MEQQASKRLEEIRREKQMLL